MFRREPAFHTQARGAPLAMDPHDRLFGEIAIQLQLLTREQVARCVQLQQEDRAGVRIGSIAVELGYLSDGEVKLLLSQQQRVIERRMQAAQQAGGVAEEQAAQAAGAQAPPAPKKRRSPRNDWAPAEPSEPPREEAPGRQSTDVLEIPGAGTAVATPAGVPPGSTMVGVGAAVEREAASHGSAAFAGTIMQPSGALAKNPPAAAVNERWGAAAPAAARARNEELEAFPMAEGTDRVDIGALSSRPAPAQGPQATAAAPVVTPARGGVPGAAGATVMQPFSAGAGASATASPMPAAAPVQAPAAPSMPAAPAAPPAPATHAAHAPDPHAEVTAKSPRAKLPKPSPMPDNLLGTYLGKALQHAIKGGASDLHVHSGAPLYVRIDGTLRPLGGGAITADAAERVIAELMTEHQWQVLADHGELDFAFDLAGLARLRVNVYRQQRGLDIVFRIIPPQPPTLEQLGLPSKLARLTDYRTGLVLCTGPTGCGKSSTLAALVNLLVQSRPDHILTIEDPIEYTYPPSKALVNQREVGGHTMSFARALRAALREDPDIIAITELRDVETISLAMSAAETGHLVLGTLHTGNAGQTINRMISVFPAEEQDQVRVMLAESLRAVLSQRLVPLAAGKGRAPAIELMMVNTAVSNIIREDKSHQLPSVMQTGKAAGMITLDDSLAELVSSGKITKDDARRHAVKKERFR